MEQVLAISELVDIIVRGTTFLDEIKMIAKIRMVNRCARDLFVTVVGAESKTRCGFTRTATTYTVRNFYGREPFYPRPQHSGFLNRIQVYDEDCSVDREYADVIHVHLEDFDSVETGFDISVTFFIAINRLFGLNASDYEVLLVKKRGSSENALVEVKRSDVTVVTVGSKSYELVRNIYLSFNYAAYYMFYGQLHGCDKDFGNFINVIRLEKITW